MIPITFSLPKPNHYNHNYGDIFHPSNIIINPHLHDTSNITDIFPPEQLTYDNSSISPPIDISSDSNSNLVNPSNNVKHLHTFMIFT